MKIIQATEYEVCVKRKYLLWQLRKFFVQRPKFRDRFHLQGSASLFVRPSCTNAPDTVRYCSVNKRTKFPLKRLLGNNRTVRNKKIVSDRNNDQRAKIERTYDFVEYPVSHGEDSSSIGRRW